MHVKRSTPRLTTLCTALGAAASVGLVWFTRPQRSPPGGFLLDNGLRSPMPVKVIGPSLGCIARCHRRPTHQCRHRPGRVSHRRPSHRRPCLGFGLESVSAVIRPLLEVGLSAARPHTRDFVSCGSRDAADLGLTGLSGYDTGLWPLVGEGGRAHADDCRGRSKMDDLVSVQWLAEHLDNPQLRVFDATVQVSRRLWMPSIRSGRREWRQAHIPGSAFANLFDLADPDRPKRTMTTPAAEWFAARAGALGIADDTRVVVYDRRENMWAARLWWMLRTFGFDNAAVLDGGWTAWQQQDYPVCTTPCGYPPATFHATARPDLVVDKQTVLAALADPGVV